MKPYCSPKTIHKIYILKSFNTDPWPPPFFTSHSHPPFVGWSIHSISGLSFPCIFCMNEQLSVCFLISPFFLHKGWRPIPFYTCCFYIIVGIIPDQSLEITPPLFCSCISLPCLEVPFAIANDATMINLVHMYFWRCIFWVDSKK